MSTKQQKQNVRMPRPLIITTTPFEELQKMVGASIASQMKQDASDYLIMAKREVQGSSHYVEIAAMRENWKAQNADDLSEEDYLIDQLAFLAAAIELDMDILHKINVN